MNSATLGSNKERFRKNLSKIKQNIIMPIDDKVRHGKLWKHDIIKEASKILTLPSAKIDMYIWHAKKYCLSNWRLLL